MQPKSQRRTHGAQFKAQVLAECQKPGASVAAVALVHGLNVNLVRKWLVGRGLKRTGLAAPRTVTRIPRAACEPTAASLQFIPVELAAAATATDEATAPGVSPIHIELTRVNTLGEARAHNGYLFANARASRLKLLMHDGFGVWCATRRLHAGRFVWCARGPGSAAALQLSTQQFEALALGLPWQRLGELSSIRRC